MGGRSPDWARIHQKESLGFWTLPLAFFSIPYAVAGKFRSWSYNSGLLKKRSLPGFVVSIGNLTVGGTGKTPAVAMLARWAQGKGYRVAVLSRGYGGKYRDTVKRIGLSMPSGIRPPGYRMKIFLIYSNGCIDATQAGHSPVSAWGSPLHWLLPVPMAAISPP